jgi:hypothetical protein
MARGEYKMYKIYVGLLLAVLCCIGGSVFADNLKVAQAQYKICTTEGNEELCVIRSIDHTCPDFYMTIGKQWYSSVAEACANAKQRDNCRGGTVGGC